jgi:hypothetical protein
VAHFRISQRHEWFLHELADFAPPAKGNKPPMSDKKTAGLLVPAIAMKPSTEFQSARRP